VPTKKLVVMLFERMERKIANMRSIIFEVSHYLMKLTEEVQDIPKLNKERKLQFWCFHEMVKKIATTSMICINMDIIAQTCRSYEFKDRKPLRRSSRA
jgi:hypothetical protein